MRKCVILLKGRIIFCRINYSLFDKDGNLFPCAVYIKIDELSDGNYLMNAITVDNSKGNKDTEETLKEVLDAYGIQVRQA